MKEITILLPSVDPPDVDDTLITIIHNITSKLKEKLDLKIIWVIFRLRKNFSNNAKKNIDGNGMKRISKLILKNYNKIS